MVIAALALGLLAGAPSDGDADALPRARAAIAALDLAELERVRAAMADRGADVAVGELAALHDSSRALRCLELPPIPAHEDRAWLGPRLLLRLEALRTHRRRAEAAHGEDADITRLLALAQTGLIAPPRGRPAFVAWPVVEERWPEEAVEPALEPSLCGGRPPSSPRAAEEGSRAAELIALGPPLPAIVRPRLLLLALERRAPLSVTASVAAWVDGGEPALVAPALLRLARRAEALGQPERAVELYRRVVASQPRTDAEDGWARARATALLEEPPAIIELALGARAPRPLDAAALAYAEARARYVAGDLDGLERFGRGWLARRASGSAPEEVLRFDRATEDLLVSLALVRPPERAIAWTESLGPRGERDDRLDKLAQRAIEVGQPELAAHVYDQLRHEAAADRARGGAPAVSRLARWLGGRAHVEYARGDVERFADFVGELEHIATDESDRPLARTAPHRAITVLCQALLGPLTEARALPQTRAYAAILVHAIDALTATATRWSRPLTAYRAPLAELAGVVGEVKRTGKRGAPPIRSVGVVTLPRPAPRLPAPDDPPPPPPIGGFWVRSGATGAWEAGPPWPAK